ncbi:hypothetical protein BCR39DRAFT_509168 [Naematelia encephala]|uniref:Arf-GAP domain-containing protein n=1 Tax=Naematelia encephala TaxID=71784 RepID=A0A1Y2BKU5_9TREE|nr:hypothetical protein BCR39DRAFT_509168 [Naematelia encephala]
MSRQDKATTERNARILRELVKQPDNKSCADCRKNDARWASWNLGVYLCIRCSGIHRSMGTHISRVKSIDLDIWTPEQMENIQKWGNRRANLYWERHLKAGHTPPDHKIESFIRSKYESRRWAMSGPPPADPSVLDEGEAQSSAGPAPAQPTSTSSAPPPVPAGRPQTHPLLSRTVPPKAAPAPVATPIVDLIGGDDPAPAPTAAPTQPPAAAPAQATSAAAPPAPTAPSSSIFDLDFRAPAPQATSKPPNAKADIMSLFSASSPSTAVPPSQPFFGVTNSLMPTDAGLASWGGGITSSAPPVQQQPITQAPITNTGWPGMQVDQGAWGAPQQASTAPNANPWGGSSDPWASSGNGSANVQSGLGQVSPEAAKKERDPFANIWQ